MARQPGRNQPTIYDVAAAAGVSKSLVSLVINGSGQVSAARRAAVLAAIDNLGYRPSRAAATLAAARSAAVGVLIDDYRNPWFVDLLEGLRDVLEPHGYHLTVAEQRASRADEALEAFLGSRVDALVVAAELAGDHSGLGVPAVMVGTREHDVAGADHVATDEPAGVGMVVRHLASLGHRRIGHVTGAGGSARRRLDAYRAEVAALGEPPRCAGEGVETNEEGGYAGTVELLRRYPEVSAVFAANDTMALGARAALSEAGRQVPEGAALVGYDDSLLARSRFLSLTTVDSRNAEVGRAAAEALLGRIRDADAPAQSVVIAPRLVVRSSSGVSVA